MSVCHCVCLLSEGSLRRGSLHQHSSWCRPAFVEAERRLRSWESQMDQVGGMETGEPLSSSFTTRSSACSLGSEARPTVSSPGERARRSACLPPRRWTWRTSLSFRKAVAQVLFAQAYYEREYHYEQCSCGAELALSALEKKVADCASPCCKCSAPAGRAPRSVSMPVISRFRSRCC